MKQLCIASLYDIVDTPKEYAKMAVPEENHLDDIGLTSFEIFMLDCPMHEV